MGEVWPDAQVARLRELLSKSKTGYFTSARTLALDLNKEFGTTLTRNSVIGKVTRLGLQLPNKPHPPKPPGYRHAPTVRRKSPPKPLPKPQPARDVVQCALVQLTEETCRWPIGNPQDRGFGFCGDPVSAGCYCARHDALAFDRGKRRTGLNVRSWRR